MEKGQVTLFRYDPERDKHPHHETHEFPFEPGMSVLDVAIYVYENIDGSFGFGYCCRNSHCGGCAAKINGKPGLMCRETATREMRLDPLDNLPVMRDLLVDRAHYQDCLLGLRLFLERTEGPKTQPEKVGREDLDRFKVVSRCVTCHICVSVCPAYKANRHEFLGPAGFVQLARHAFDPRDELNREIIAYSAGVDKCILCGKCEEACPHGISPKKTIESLRTMLESA